METRKRLLLMKASLYARNDPGSPAWVRGMKQRVMRNFWREMFRPSIFDRIKEGR